MCTHVGYLCAYCVKELLFITYYIIIKLTRRNKHHFNIKLSIQLFDLIRFHLLKCFLSAQDNMCFANLKKKKKPKNSIMIQIH